MNRNLIFLLAAGALGIILLSLAMKPGSFPGMTLPMPPDTQNQPESADATAAKAMMARGSGIYGRTWHGRFDRESQCGRP